MTRVKVRGGYRAAVCIAFAILLAWLWLHSSFHSRSDEGLTNCNTLIFRRAGLAIGSWRGRLAIGHMDNPKYKQWNEVPLESDPHCSGLSVFGGMVDYQACDDGSANWDFDFDYPAKLATNRLGSAWQFAGFAFASHTVSQDVDIVNGKTPPIAVRTVCFAIPDYLIVLLLLIYPAIWMRRKRMTARRLNEGLCVKCGYDLRAGHTACPECGATAGVVPTQE